MDILSRPGKGKLEEAVTRLFSGINVVSISVTDLDGARTSYGDTLGLGPPLFDLPEQGWIEFQPAAPTAISR